jgi:acyl-CoA synthetase (AMP-forming)/AMP-acid ligase II
MTSRLEAMTAQRLGVPVGDFIRLSAQRVPTRTCFVDDVGRAYTFAEVNERVNRLADALGRRGVQRGDRIAIFAVDSVQYLETILASMKLGTTYVALNYRLRPAELLNFLQIARPVALMLSSRYAELISVAAEVSSISTVVGLDDAVPGALRYEDLLVLGNPRNPEVVANDDDILSIAFTSGTTGVAKGVLQSHRMFKAMLVQRLFYYQVAEDDFRYSASPSFHIGGIGMTLLGVFAGFASLILPQFDVVTVQRYLAEGGLTACFMVPTMIRSMLSLPTVRDADYESLRLLIYGSSPMPPALLREAIDVFDCDLMNAFGAGTEAGMQTILLPADHRLAAAGQPRLLESIGRPVLNVDLKLCDANGVEVGPGEVGEIVTRGETIMSGYLDQPELTAKTMLPGGWIRCGDLASRDDEGYLYLAGRRDDMIIRGGENIYPVEIESVLAELTSISEVVVVGQPDEKWGQTVHAYLLLRAGAAFDEQAARDLCRHNLAAYKVPETFTVMDAFPRNASGKVLRRELRREGVSVGNSA